MNVSTFVHTIMLDMANTPLTLKEHSLFYSSVLSQNCVHPVCQIKFTMAFSSHAGL